MKKLLGLLLLLVGAFIVNINILNVGFIYNYVIKFIGAYILVQGGLLIFKK